MRSSVVLVALSALRASAGLHHALAEDMFAFPKYRVAFLDGLPVLNETAERWLDVGLKGGELEFLEQPWEESAEQGHSVVQGIEGADSIEVEPPEPAIASTGRLQRMRLSSQNSYICLIPPASEDRSALLGEEEQELDATATQSLSLLKPLSGSCLYHRDGWFTYSYCHNHQVRQFREMPHPHPHPPGYKPQEDPDWESFTLGQAPNVPSDGVESSVSQQDVLMSSVELAHAPSHHYLVEKWGDGTLCDKTGRPREIEVQFHCSLTTTDMILFVRETRTCAYVMVIHTHRLCGEPGFKTRLEQREEAYIRCREVVDDMKTVEQVDETLAEVAHPFKQHMRRPILGVSSPPAHVPSDASEGDIKGGTQQQRPLNDVLRLAIERLIKDAFSGVGDTDHGRDESGEPMQTEVVDEEGRVWIQLVNVDEVLEGQGGGWLGENDGGRLEKALHAAGFSVEKAVEKDDDSEEKKAVHDGL